MEKKLTIIIADGSEQLCQQIAAAGIARQGAIAASAVVLMVPPLAIFIAAQSNVMETMAHAGMKD